MINQLMVVAVRKIVSAKAPVFAAMMTVSVKPDPVPSTETIVSVRVTPIMTIMPVTITTMPLSLLTKHQRNN